MWLCYHHFLKLRVEKRCDHLSESSSRRISGVLDDEGSSWLPLRSWQLWSSKLKRQLYIQNHPYAQPWWSNQWKLSMLTCWVWPKQMMENTLENTPSNNLSSQKDDCLNERRKTNLIILWPTWALTKEKCFYVWMQYPKSSWRNKDVSFYSW